MCNACHFQCCAHDASRLSLVIKKHTGTDAEIDISDCVEDHIE